MERIKNLTVLKHRSNSSHHRRWLRWLSCFKELNQRIINNDSDFKPLSFNEATSVGLLASAAFFAGGFGLVETVSFKRAEADSDEERNGRDDLSIVLDDINYYFEAKQIFRPTPRNLEQYFKEAMNAAELVITVNNLAAAGCLIIYISDDYWKNKKLRKRYTDNIKSFCKDTPEVTFAVALDNRDIYKARTFILFSGPNKS